MSVDERARHQLHQWALEAMGPERAATLMSLLPPVGWSDVATKDDLYALEARLALRSDLVDQRFTSVGQRFTSVDQRFTNVDQRFDAIDQRFDAVDQRFDRLEAHLDRHLDDRLDGLRHELTAVFERGLRDLTVRIMFSLVGTVIAMGSVTVAVAG